MTMSLRMMMKPPVAFYCPDPEKVFSGKEVHNLLDRCRFSKEVFPTLWAAYCREVLDEVEPCMEPNGGARETLFALSRRMGPSIFWSVTGVEGRYEIRMEKGVLYLQETEDGGLYLYFLPPEGLDDRNEEGRLDLSGYSSEAAAEFICTISASRKKVFYFFGQSLLKMV